jgi:hypothetical protein
LVAEPEGAVLITGPSSATLPRRHDAVVQELDVRAPVPLTATAMLRMHLSARV